MGCKELFDTWVWGLTKLYPPYEAGLASLQEELQRIQQSYEKKFEEDVAWLFSKKDGILLKKYKFRIKGSNEDVGDYDVIFIDKNNKVIWNIECKYLGYIGSTQEYYNYQQRFFTDTKNYKDKFEKRIEYLKENLLIFLELQKIKDISGYNIINILATNKVFEPTIKLENFKMISYDELRKELENQKKNI